MAGLVQLVARYSDWMDDYTSYMTGLLLMGELDVYSLDDLVRRGKEAAGDGVKIDRLEIYAHGSDTYIAIGDDILHDATPKVHMPKLAMLRNVLNRDALVVLYVCQAGNLRELLPAMAAALNARVYATTGDVYPNRNAATGESRLAHPDGTIEHGVGDKFWIEPADHATSP